VHTSEIDFDRGLPLEWPPAPIVSDLANQAGAKMIVDTFGPALKEALESRACESSASWCRRRWQANAIGSRRIAGS
jgi:hypothetical protein